jgi:uncharacterized surface protein with fasciclin (FAS1) repeats
MSGGVLGAASGGVSGGQGGQGSLVINNVTVNLVKTDIPASNGMIDAIGTVLLPTDVQNTLSQVSGGASGGAVSSASGGASGGAMSGGASGGAVSGGASGNTLGTVLSQDPQFSTLVGALKTAGLFQNLQNNNRPYTILAPTNAAFNKLPKAQLQALLNNHNELVEVLQYHLISGKYTLQSLSGLPAVVTLTGQTLTLSTPGGASGGAASGGVVSGGAAGAVSGGAMSGGSGGASGGLGR